MQHLAANDSFYLVTRHVCMNCNGAGYHANPITNERRKCSECGGIGVTDEVEPVYPEEFAAMKALIDVERDRPNAWKGMDSGPISIPWVAADICGFCGQPGADKEPHPIRWPGEKSAGTPLVHAECEDEECRRAHSELSDREREGFLREVSRYTV